MNIGAKAYNLELLQNKGFRVPAFITLPNTIISEEAFYKEIATFIQKDFLYAVRSSSTNEDTNETAMAGKFYSAVAVSYTQLFVEYLNVIASFNSSQGTVIIQEFICSEKSGVLFTNAGNHKQVINANFGLCKSVVEGWACDEYLFENGKFLHSEIPSTKKGMIVTSEKSIQIVENNSIVFTPKELDIIIAEGQKIEAFFNFPQDIEFCMYENKLFILQSRPITRPIFTNIEAGIFDNANIAESYSGIVLPLTFSFAQQIYKIVYINLLHASGVRMSKLLKHESIFNNMLASFYGRMYYNMTNWYLMMSFVPGYERNKENLESMISSNVNSEILRTVKPSIWYTITYPLIVIVKLFFLQSKITKFIRETKNEIQLFRNKNIRKATSKECKEIYANLYCKLLNSWHIPVENDFMVMTYFGILRKRMSDEEIQKHIHFSNKSVEQINTLKKLAQKLCEYPKIFAAISNFDSAQFEQELANETDAHNLFVTYFETYGGRFGNELKLESSDIEEDAQKLFSLFLAYKNSHVQESNTKHSSEKLSKVDSFLIKKFIFYASQREELRLLRSNCFSIVRKICNRMGQNLFDQNRILNPNDVYFLTFDEMFSEQSNYKELIETRKKEYDSYSHIEPAPFFNLESNEQIPLKTNSKEHSNHIQGRSCTPGIITGKVKVFKEYHIPQTIDFDILVAKHTDPGWTTLIGLSKGLIIEHGGVLSHAAIVSRELGLPTVIGVENATEIFSNNMTVTVNGTSGIIEIV